MWITTVEEAVLQHSEVPVHQRDSFRGRAQGFGVKWKVSTASPGRPQLYNPEADWVGDHSYASGRNQWPGQEQQGPAAVAAERARFSATHTAGAR
eukprot:9446648-Pyramimonas_sp.AAC.1